MTLKSEVPLKELIAQLESREAVLDDELKCILDRHQHTSFQAIQERVSKLSALRLSIKDSQENANGLARFVAEHCELADVVSKRVRQLDEAVSRANSVLTLVNNVSDLRKCFSGLQAVLRSIVGVTTGSRSLMDLSAACKHWSWYVDTLPLLPSNHDGSSQQVRLASLGEELINILEDEVIFAVKGEDLEKVSSLVSFLVQVGQLERAIKLVTSTLRGKLHDISMKVLKDAVTEAKSQAAIYRAGGGARIAGGATAAAFEASFSVVLNTAAGMIQSYAANVAGAFSFSRNDSQNKENIRDETDGEYRFDASAFCCILLHEIHDECSSGASLLLKAYMKHRRLHKRAEIVSNDQAKRAEKGEVAVSEADVASLDQVLDEAAVMTQHSESYKRFVSAMALVVSKKNLEGCKQDCSNIPNTVEAMLPKNGALQQATQELAGLIVVLDGFFMWTGMAKAARIEEECGGYGEARYSSAVEDAFYVVQKCALRAFATGNDMVCGAVIHHIYTAISEDLLGIFAPKRIQMIHAARLPPLPSDMGGGRSSSNSGSGNSGGDGNGGGDRSSIGVPVHVAEEEEEEEDTNDEKKGKSTSPQRSHHLNNSSLDRGLRLSKKRLGKGLWMGCVSVNSLSISSKYVSTLAKQLRNDVEETFNSKSENSKDIMIYRRLLSGLGELESCQIILGKTTIDGINAIVNSLRLRSLVTRAASPGCPAFEYDLKEVGHRRRQKKDFFSLHLLRPLRETLEPFERALTKENVNRLVEIVASRIIFFLLRVIGGGLGAKLKTGAGSDGGKTRVRPISELGALQLDKDVRRLVSMFSNYLGRSKARQKCEKLLFFTALVNLENPTETNVKNVVLTFTTRKTEEIFSKDEIKAILSKRSEFSKTNIDALNI
eukprot:g5704.t1